MIARAVVAGALAAGLVAAGCGDETDPGSGAARTATVPGDAVDVAFSSSVESGLPVGYPKPKPADLTVALLLPNRAAEPVSIIAKSFEATVKGLGGTPILYDAQLQPDRQLSQMEQAIARKVDGIVLFPLDARAVSTGIARAKKAGIPVIGLEYNNRDKDDIGGLDSQILYGVDRLAYEQVKAMAAALGPGGKVVHIGLNTPAPVLTRLSEQTRLWAKRFGLEYLGDVKAQKDDVAGGEEAATRALSEYPDAEGILAYTDAPAIGAAASARAQGKRDLTILGNFGGASDGLDAVKDGRIAGTVLFNLPDVGRFAAWGVYDAVEDPGTPLPRSVTVRPPLPVDQDNVGEIPRS